MAIQSEVFRARLRETFGTEHQDEHEPREYQQNTVRESAADA